MSAKEHSIKSADTPWKNQNLASCDIILVDADDGSVQHLINDQMPSLHTEVTVNFDNIIKRITNKRYPSLIMINITNQKFDAFNILMRLKRNSQSSSIPVIMVSENASVDERIRAYGLGCEDFISLPMSQGEFSAVISSKIKTQEKQQHIQQLAYNDELTGITNRRGYNQALSAEWARCRRTKSTLSMLLIDIDGFKGFNDQYGHNKGDQLIQFAANTLKHVCARSTDLVARFGGDEFVILLPDSDYNSSSRLAQMLIDEFKARVGKAIGVVPRANVTISIGIASFVPTANVSPMDLFDGADQALYQAKALGKGCWQRFHHSADKPFQV